MPSSRSKQYTAARILGGMNGNKNNQVLVVSRGANSPNIAGQVNQQDGLFTDFYLYLITCSWPRLLLQIGAAFFLANLVFAAGYSLDGGIDNAHSFGDTYFFSVETMATIGYGKLSPVSLISNLLMSVEALTGMLGIAVVTGLIFAKFSRPTSRVRFSNQAVVTQRDGVPSLMFRMANIRSNQIVEAQIHVVFSRMERTLEGEETRRFQDISLTRNRNAIFAYSWVAVHQIVPGSPLYGETAESLAASGAWILVALTGLDETFSQTVHARKYYGNKEIVWGARLTDVMVHNDEGGFSLDFAKFDLIESAPPPPWHTEKAALTAIPEESLPKSAGSR